MQDLIGDTFLKKKILEKEVEINDKFEPAGEEELEDIKILALYFSAYNCPASRIFTNVFKEVYTEINSASENSAQEFLSKLLLITYLPYRSDLRTL